MAKSREQHEATRAYIRNPAAKAAKLRDGVLGDDEFAAQAAKAAR